jgi:anaerobic ribonucleoside-triphosphate reductase activating protein
MTEPTLRIRRTHFPVTTLGPGRRYGIWVQGCPLACHGCMSRDTWDPTGGIEVEVGVLVAQWKAAIRGGADGLTISGGEPLTQAVPLADLLRRVRAVADDRDLLMYTGYEVEELNDVQAATAGLADVLVTGRYMAGSPTDLIWRGSENQTMVVQTDLGRVRFAAYAEARPADAPVEIRPDTDGVWIIGVPRPGVLRRIEKRLREIGLPPDDVTWRP